MSPVISQSGGKGLAVTSLMAGMLTSVLGQRFWLRGLPRDILLASDLAKRPSICVNVDFCSLSGLVNKPCFLELVALMILVSLDSGYAGWAASDKAMSREDMINKTALLIQHIRLPFLSLFSWEIIIIIKKTHAENGLQLLTDDEGLAGNLM